MIFALCKPRPVIIRFSSLKPATRPYPLLGGASPFNSSHHPYSILVLCCRWLLSSGISQQWENERRLRLKPRAYYPAAKIVGSDYTNEKWSVKVFPEVFQFTWNCPREIQEKLILCIRADKRKFLGWLRNDLWILVPFVAKKRRKLWINFCRPL